MKSILKVDFGQIGQELWSKDLAAVSYVKSFNLYNFQTDFSMAEVVRCIYALWN